MAKSYQDIQNELGIDENNTTEELLAKLNEYNVVSANEITKIISISVDRLENQVTGKAKEVKRRMYEPVTNDTKGIVSVLNKRIVLLDMIVKKLKNVELLGLDVKIDGFIESLDSQIESLTNDLSTVEQNLQNADNEINASIDNLNSLVDSLDRAVSELTGVDTSFSEEIAEIKVSNEKALYNLGAYDTISGNTITRRTGRFEINDNTCSFAYYDSYCVVVPLTDIKTSSNMLVKCNRLTSVYDSDILNNIYKINASDNNFAIIGPNMSMTSDSWKAFLSQAPLYIEYELSTSYEEEIIENQPLITLDSQGSKWLTDEYKKGINKLNPALFNNRTEWNTSGNSTTVFFIKLYYTDTFAWDDAVCQFELGTSDAYGRHNYTFTTDGRNNGKLYGVIGINGNVADDKNVFEINLSAGTYVYSAFLENASLDRYNIKEFMISDGDYPYEPYNANKHISNFEAEFLKEESLKSAQLFDPTKILTGYISSNGELEIPNSMVKFYEIDFEPNTQYTLSGYTKNSVSNGNGRLRIVYTDGTESGAVLLNSSQDYVYSTFTSISGKTIDYIACDYGNSGYFYIKELMLNKGTEVIPYHEFEGSIVRTKELEEIKEKLEFTMGSVYDSYERTVGGTGLHNGIQYTYSGTLQTYKGLSITPTITGGSLTYNSSNGIINYTLTGGSERLFGTITVKYNMLELWENRGVSITTLEEE